MKYVCEFAPDGKHFIAQKGKEKVKLETAQDWLAGNGATKFKYLFRDGKIRIRNLTTNKVIENV